MTVKLKKDPFMETYDICLVSFQMDEDNRWEICYSDEKIFYELIHETGMDSLPVETHIVTDWGNNLLWVV